MSVAVATPVTTAVPMPGGPILAGSGFRTDPAAHAVGCNAVSDGRHVVVDQRATTFVADLAARGFVATPRPIDDFTKAGGGIKCLTMQVRPRCTPSQDARPTTPGGSR